MFSSFIVSVILFAYTYSVFAQVPWIAFNGGGSRSGINSNESLITHSSVANLKLKWSTTISNRDDPIDSSPVLWPNVVLPGGTTADMLFFNSLLGTLYAVNADTGVIIWKNTVTVACETTDCITKSSPAIDPNGLFVYCWRVDGTVRKYAIASGEEVSGNGFPVFMTYIPTYEQGSAPINIVGNTLYMTTSGDNHDDSWYVGKVVSVDLATGETNVWNALCSNLRYILQSKDCTVDDRNGAGIWSRGSVVSHPDGKSIYVAVGNGLFNANNGGFYYGDSLVRLLPGLPNTTDVIMDSYTPSNYQDMQDKDYDLGSSSPCILPSIPASKTPNMLVQASKDSFLRLINRDNMSGQGCCGHVGGEVHQVAYPDGFVYTAPLSWQDPVTGIVWVYVVTTDAQLPDTGFHAYQVLTDEVGVSTLNLKYTLKDAGTSPFLANNILFVQGLLGISALDPVTGEILWTSSRTQGLHWQSPIVINGRVYSSDNSGNIYAWSL